MHLRLTLLFALLLLVGCGPFPPPTRTAVDRRQLLPVREDKALVIFMFPPCARYSGPVANDEEMMLCRQARKHRIRVVEQGARLVTDFGVNQYGAAYVEPGRHLYGAFHYADHCAWNRTDCVAALKANLLPGKTYFVTFRWNHDLTSRNGLLYGRLEITPVTPAREAIFLARLAEIDRVEPIPGHREKGYFGELRSFYVSQRALERVAQDRKDGVPIPHLGGRVFVEEIKEDEEQLKNQQPKDQQPKDQQPKDQQPEEQPLQQQPAQQPTEQPKE
jgi:hypothetical protein